MQPLHPSPINNYNMTSHKDPLQIESKHTLNGCEGEIRNPPENDASAEEEMDDMTSLSLLLKVEQLDGSALPSFVFTAEAVTAMCHIETGYSPVWVDFLNDYKCYVWFEAIGA